MFLDEALGEYDVETHVGAIVFFNRESKYFEHARPLSELPAHFDEKLGESRVANHRVSRRDSLLRLWIDRDRAEGQLSKLQPAALPALNLSFDDPRLKQLGIWSKGYAYVLVCPACAHYMEPYFVHHRPAVHVVGGYHDGGDVIQNIDLPYKARLLHLCETASVPHDVPGHRIGGKPPDRCPDLGRCPSCKAALTFFGVLAYYDLNIPLTEDGGRPVALIIGDSDCLAISACRKCSVLRLAWVY